MKRRTVALAAGAAAVGVIAIVAANGNGDPGDGHPTVGERVASAVESEKAKETPSGPLKSFRDGFFLVGTDVVAGTYRTDGKSHATFDQPCYWARMKDDSGSMDAIIANDLNEGPGRVTVHVGEYFKTSGECDWKLVR